MMMRACDVMTVKVAGIHPKATLVQAIGLMADLDLTTLPVIDVSGVLVGMLTAGDILRRTPVSSVQSRVSEAWNCDGFDHVLTRRAGYDPTVEVVMTAEICAVQAQAPIAEVERLMKNRRIKCLPVLRGDKLVGLIGHGDLAHALGEDFDAVLGAATPRDSAIKDAVVAALHRLTWTPCPLIDVMVEDGKVELHGTLLKADERSVLRTAVETIPGVTGFTDHLVLAAPLDNMFPRRTDDMARRQKLY